MPHITQGQKTGERLLPGSRGMPDVGNKIHSDVTPHQKEKDCYRCHGQKNHD